MNIIQLLRALGVDLKKYQGSDIAVHTPIDGSMIGETENRYGRRAG